MKHALVLFSGGLDSTTALYWAIEKYEHVHALTFDYGQRHRIELDSSQKITENLNIPQKMLRIDLQQIGGSSLTDPATPLLPFEPSVSEKDGPPSTYVPFRNGIFLALAAAWAEVRGYTEIVCGFHVLDSPDYPDTREEFVKAMEEAINQGSRASYSQRRINIRAPFLEMNKAEIITKGLSLGADYSYSVSCYAGTEIPCGECAACRIRQNAWEKIGAEDPLLLRIKKEGER
ncbi:MAG: 7-cyano-7-deazaguanine synthase QueC [Candidatus Aminicenantes bacterium]|jgi:7-cyano-7-deazaguanine synthase